VLRQRCDVGTTFFSELFELQVTLTGSGGWTPLRPTINVRTQLELGTPRLKAHDYATVTVRGWGVQATGKKQVD